MLNIYNPTIFAPTTSSPHWYVQFHASYYISQITNNILLSGLDGMAIEAGSDRKDLSFDERAVVGAENAVSAVIAALHKRPQQIGILLTAMGFEVEGSEEGDVRIEKETLLHATNCDVWLDVLKGFLNIWEFMFLFSAVESTLKRILNKVPDGMGGLLNAVVKENPNFEHVMRKTHFMDRNMFSTFWELFYRVRNMYAHSHGYLEEADVPLLKRYAADFNKSFEKYIGRLSEHNAVQAVMEVQDEGFFPAEGLVVGKFYLMRDVELNLFRNLISQFMFELQRDAEKSAQL